MKNEQDLSAYVRAIFSDRGEDFTRIETTTENGVPDMNVCSSGFDAWIEMKFIHRKVPVLRKEQYAWGLRRAQCGGLVIVLAYDPMDDMIKLYKFPDIQVKSRGDNKTLDLVSRPHCSGIRSEPNTRKLIKKFLFPCL